MAESSSPALPGDVEWLPGPGGTRVLRIHPAASAQPPALILRLPGGGERRIERRPAPARVRDPGRAGLERRLAQWPDGTRAALPLPHGPHAEVIQLRPRRFARSPRAAPRPAPAASAPPLASATPRPSAPIAGADVAPRAGVRRRAGARERRREPDGRCAVALERGRLPRELPGACAGAHSAPAGPR